jgi:predicted helicase
MPNAPSCSRSVDAAVQVAAPLGTSERDMFRVAKTKILKTKGKEDRSTIVYNSWVTLSNIPEEAIPCR